MAKMTIMRGLPASGKSTKAEELLAQGNTVRINKDLLRTMLHFDKFNGRNEGHTRDAARKLAEHFLSSGINVIIDDTNLNPGTVQSWVNLAKTHQAKIEYQDFSTVPVDECIARDLVRAKKVGSHVIQKMALQYLGYWEGKATVICDIDGTLADCEHRKHFLKGEKKDWKGFFGEMSNDSLREDVFKKLEDQPHQKRILVSARPEEYRAQTEAWLWANGVVYDLLIMRNSNDKREDTIVKSEIYENYLKKLAIIKVFDDRPSVIRMWREKGLKVEDVGNGVEF